MWAPAGKCALLYCVTVLSRDLTCLSLWKFYFISNFQSLATRDSANIHTGGQILLSRISENINPYGVVRSALSLSYLTSTLPFVRHFRRNFPENCEKFIE